MSGNRRKSAYHHKTVTYLRNENSGLEYGFNHTQNSKIVTDVMGDQDHAWPPKKGNRRDIGGSFALTKYLAYPSFVDRHIESERVGAITYHLEGQIMPVSIAGASFPVAPVLSNGALYAWGSTGFARTIPTRPLASVATMLGEAIVDGPGDRIPAIARRWEDTAREMRNDFRRARDGASGWMRRARRARQLGRDVGETYIDQAFGWFPFLSEVYELTHAFLDRNRRIAQFERDSGRLVRRRIVLEDESWSDPIINRGSSYGSPTGSSYLWSGPGTLTELNSYRRKTWFSAAFMYYIRQTGAGLLHARGAQMRNLLFGTDITPSTLWEIAPWSWLADYGTNIGDVLTNMSQFSRDNLVARHAYVMSEATATREYTLTGLRPRKGGPITTSLTLKTVAKRRARGDPYVFALTPAPLTGRQQAVLAALGLTRL